jgi:signal transduction histidine kinase
MTALTRGRLGWLLVQFGDAIVERWKARVLEDPSVPNANRLSTPALEDHIPQVISRLLQRLEVHPPEEWGERVGRELGGSGLSARHARERISEHYTLPQALRELSHFRATVLDFCVEQLVSLNPEEAKLLHTAIDEMMATSAGALQKVTTSIYEQAMGVVAHDLRNPLNTITMQAARLEQGSTEAKAGQVLSRCARMMNRLVEDLLTYSRLEAGHFSIHAAEADPREILKEAAEHWAPLAQKRGIDLVLSPPRTENVRLLLCDRDRVMQALGNVVGNAIKFTPQGGCVRLELEERAGSCVLRVSDTGPGVAPEHVEHLFHPFWQGPESKQGAGLGLAIARGILEAHRGEIAIEPHAPPGATFVLALPYDAAPAQSASFPKSAVL